MNPIRRKLESLFTAFLDALRHDQLLDLCIPISASSIAQTTENATEMGGDYDQTTKLCRLTNGRSSKKYVQIFAVAVLVLELIIKSKTISQR